VHYGDWVGIYAPVQTILGDSQDFESQVEAAVAFANHSLNQLRDAGYLASTPTAPNPPTVEEIPFDSADWVGREVRYSRDMSAMIDAELQDPSQPRIDVTDE
jgi:hypothetical protein